MNDPGLFERLDTLTVIAWIRPRLLYALACVLAVTAAELIVGWLA
jgi:hypothetical protein